MGKYYFSYALFLLPALVAALFFNNGSAAATAVGWILSLVFLAGAGITTYLAAYPHPRRTFAFILIYAGVNLIIYYCFYMSVFGSPPYVFLRDYGGALSYVPLGVLVDALNDAVMHAEVYVILTATACMLLGYLPALVKRRVKPYPYSPKIG
jgi:hypothetical protein